MEEAVAAQGSSSLLDMVSSSGPLVFCVLLVLLGLSVLSWATMIAKTLQFKRAKAESEEFRNIFYETKNFARIDDASRRLQASPLAHLFASGYRELLTVVQNPDGGLRPIRDPESELDMVERALRRTQLDESHRLEKGVTFLATVASSAPFIGLFGTVMGIMNAFHSLSFAKNSTIQAVAPGISEALFATAVGLAAAIPSAIAYNYLSSNLRRLRQTMDAFGDEFISVAKRSFTRG